MSVPPENIPGVYFILYVRQPIINRLATIRDERDLNCARSSVRRQPSTVWPGVRAGSYSSIGTPAWRSCSITSKIALHRKLSDPDFMVRR